MRDPLNPLGSYPHSPVASLYERLSKKIDQRRAITLSAEDLDWFVVSGAYRALLNVVADQREAQARARIEGRGGDISFLDVNEEQAEVPAQSEPAEPVERPEVFSPATLAKWWGVSSQSIYQRIRSGELRHFKLGEKLYRIRADAVDEYERSHGYHPRGRGQ